MLKKGLIVPPGGGSILSMAPGRSAALKLLGGDTGDSIMLFEETAPAGTDTTFHFHRDSDEVAYVLSGEITFKIGDEVTVGGPGTCAFMPRGVPHARKNTGTETARVLFLYTPADAGGFFEEQLGRPAGSANGPEANEMRRRHGWEIVRRRREQPTDRARQFMTITPLSPSPITNTRSPARSHPERPKPAPRWSLNRRPIAWRKAS
jgi:quercetin dioxygenase-like cupin family protein